MHGGATQPAWVRGGGRADGGRLRARFAGSGQGGRGFRSPRLHAAKSREHGARRPRSLRRGLGTDGPDAGVTGGRGQPSRHRPDVPRRGRQCCGYHGISLAAIHHMPICVNGQLALPSMPSPAPWSAPLCGRLGGCIGASPRADDTQRRELGLPRAAAPAAKRMAERGSLEIQAYDEACFPGLAAEWNGRRPFVGALTLELPTDADGDVATWAATGKPPIYFGFGSTPVRSPGDTIAMIVAACTELGARALIDCEARLYPHPTF